MLPSRTSNTATPQQISVPSGLSGGGLAGEVATLRRSVRICQVGALRMTEPPRMGRGTQGGGRAGVQVHGSGDLIQTLMRHGLVDEYRLWVFPVVLGSGKRLFADGAIPGALKLVDSTVSTTGGVIGTDE